MSECVLRRVSGRESFGTFLDKLICRLNLERALGRLSNQYFKERPISVPWRRVVEFDQEGKERAEYGSALFQRLSKDLTKRFGRGFGVDNLQRMRAFYLEYKQETIYATVSRKSATNLKRDTFRHFVPMAIPQSSRGGFQTRPYKTD